MLTVRGGRRNCREAWEREEGGFLPRIPASLEQLDLLLIEEVRPPKVRRHGSHFQGLRYLSLTFAAYVGEDVTIRYDPRDLAEMQVFGTAERTKPVVDWRGKQQKNASQ